MLRENGSFQFSFSLGMLDFEFSLNPLTSELLITGCARCLYVRDLSRNSKAVIYLLWIEFICIGSSFPISLYVIEYVLKFCFSSLVTFWITVWNAVRTASPSWWLRVNSASLISPKTVLFEAVRAGLLGGDHRPVQWFWKSVGAITHNDWEMSLVETISFKDDLLFELGDENIHSQFWKSKFVWEKYQKDEGVISLLLSLRS